MHFWGENISCSNSWNSVNQSGGVLGVEKDNSESLAGWCWCFGIYAGETRWT